MLNVRYSCICSLLVLISGLISCSKDKNVRIQPDVFAPSELKLERSDRSYQLAEDIHSVDLTRNLIISSARSEDLQSGPVVFKINSLCHDIKGKQNYFSEYIQVNSPTIAVIKLIPKEILLLTKEVPIQCDFFLVTENSNRSTYSSSLKNVAVENIFSFSNMNIDFSAEKGIIYENQKDTLLVAAATETTAYLGCDEIGSTIRTSSSITLENMIGDQTKTKLTSAVQNCRMLLFSGDIVQLSPVFKLNMPVLPLQISTQVFPLEQLTGNIFKHKALEIKVSNPNNSPMKLRINNSNSSRFLFQPAIRAGTKRFMLQQLISKEIKWSAQSTNPIEAFKDHLEVIINANETTTIIANVDLNLNCERNINEPSTAVTIVFHALGFELNSEFIQEPYPESQILLPITWQAETHSSPLTPLNQWIFQFRDAGLLNYGLTPEDNDIYVKQFDMNYNLCVDI